MLAHSLIKDYHLPSGSPRCALKLDLHKAFDTLDRGFIFEAMPRMGFPAKFIGWIKSCITSCMISIKINGSLEGFFNAKSGIRQGDPLSPALFVIAMEVFSSYLKGKIAASQFNYHWRTKEVELSHLLFADDILLFSKGDLNSITTLVNTVSDFSKFSRLKVNPSKCQCFFGNVDSCVIDSALTLTGFQLGVLPVKYLGLPLFSGKLSKQECLPLVSRICDRIND